jgi:hypothetical protein
MDSKPVDLAIFQALSSNCYHSNAKVIVEIHKLLSSAVALTTTNISHSDNRVILSLLINFLKLKTHKVVTVPVWVHRA